MSETTEINSPEKCRQPTLQSTQSFCEKQEHTKCENSQLKAFKDFSPGEIVVTEIPSLIWTQLPPKDGNVPCVGCCSSVVKIAYCPNCLWPICSPACEHLKNPATHGLECKILSLHKSEFAKTPLKSFRYELLLPLRIFLNQCNNIEDQNKIDNSNEDFEYLEKILGNSVSTESLKKALSYIKRNSFRAKNIRIFYKASSSIQHTCTPNSFYTISSNFELTIRSKTAISMGTPISLSFVDLYQGTSQRISQIPCSCPRCLDPTEFGTFFSALKCLGSKSHPCGGTQLPTNPIQPDTIWVCDQCQIELPNDQIVQFVQHLEGEVDKVVEKKHTVEELEELLGKLLMFLHPNHFLVSRVKLALVRGYQEEVGAKAGLCRELIGVFGRLDCGGIILVELEGELKRCEETKNGEEKEKMN